MGMTIEEAHRILSNGLVNAPSEHEWCVAFKMAIDTMRKYQKIEQILYCHNRYTDDAAECIENLREVLADGNDD